GPERVQPLSKSVPSAGVLFQPCAELALLAFELPPLALDLGAAALQSLREILKARLFGPGAHHRVLGLPHARLAGRSRPAELVAAGPGPRSRAPPLGLLAHQTLERCAQRPQLHRHLVEPPTKHPRFGLCFGRPLLELALPCRQARDASA